MKVIAEVGCNHLGDIEVAYELIKIAAQYCKVDVVKFQKRNPQELLSEEEYNAPHPNQSNSYGRTYGEHREYLELDIEQHKKLKERCDEWGVIYSSSVWDITSAKEIISLNPEIIKIPSACNLNFDMLGIICYEHKGEIHISLGMTTHEEEAKIIEFIENMNRLNDTVFYSCTSGYPVPYEDICLREIERLKNNPKINSIGFSGHHLGIAVDIAALTLGSEYFERHFTLDRTWKGTDHAASLEPDGLRKLTRDLKNVKKALTFKSKEVLDIEEVQRKKLKIEAITLKL